MKCTLFTAASTAVLATVLGAIAVVPPEAARAAVPDAPRTWVALGDSYSAGLIAGDLETPLDGCLRTSDAYPRIAQRAARPDLTMVHRACGSAKTVNLVTPQVPPSIGDDPEWEPVPAQIDALDEDTEIVTLGIGGNTFGFGEIMLRCLLLGPEEGHENPGTPCADSYGADVSAGSIGATLDTRLAETVAEYSTSLGRIATAAPNARIVTVGYPQLTPADASTCSWGDNQQFGNIARGDLPFFRLAEERLNAGMQDATAAVGQTFVDTYAISAGHDVCSDKDTRWIEGLALDADGLDLIFVHPNGRGHAALGEAVADAVRGER